MKMYCDRCDYGVGHKCKQLKYEGNDVCIDEGMAEFIELLWANDIKTESCCEGGEHTSKDSAYVTFPSMLDYEKFLYLIHKILYEKYDGNPDEAVSLLNKLEIKEYHKPTEWDLHENELRKHINKVFETKDSRMYHRARQSKGIWGNSI